MYLELIHKTDRGRICQLWVNGKKRYTPMFIPALTTKKCSYPYKGLLKLVFSIKPKQLMLSAFDLYHLSRRNENKQYFSELKNLKKSTLTFLDSGGFEATFPFSSEFWTIDKLVEAYKCSLTDFVIAFDVVTSKEVSSDTTIRHLKETVKLVGDENANFEVVIQGKAEQIINTIKHLFQNGFIYKMNTFIIGVPERNLGFSVDVKIFELKRIREVIDNFDQNILLHLLGCSTPNLIKKYSTTGVDIFDGIRWQDLLIDKNYTFQDVSCYEETSCECESCKEYRNLKLENLEKAEKFYPFHLIFHNLLMYERLMRKIQKELYCQKAKKSC